MKSKLVMMVAAVAMAVVTSCSTVQVASPSTMNGQRISQKGDAVAHLSASSCGLYLFSIPLITGSAENPGSIAIGENSCKVTAMTDALTKKAEEMGANETIDIVSSTSSTLLYLIPLPIFFWKSVCVSGNALK